MRMRVIGMRVSVAATGMPASSPRRAVLATIEGVGIEAMAHDTTPIVR